MKTLLNRTLATLILTGVSTAALAVPSITDSLTRYTVSGYVETSELNQIVEDTYLTENYQEQYQATPRLHFEEDVTAPLETTLELAWVAE